MVSHRSQNFRRFIRNISAAISGKEEDYTSISIRRAIFLLAIPMILEMVMESIFALVDIFFVSKISINAIGVVGITENVISLIYAVAIGLSMAATAMVARRVGEKDLEKAKLAASQAIIAGITFGILTGIVGAWYAKDILRLMDAPADLIEEGYHYTQIMFGGNITILMLFLINAIFRGAGNASIAMKALIIANTLNIILDPLFIFGWGPIPAMGVKGAAIATTTGRGIAVIYQSYVLAFGRGRIRVLWNDLRLKMELMGRLIKTSLGGIGQFIVATSSWIFLMKLMGQFEVEALAGYVLSIRVIVFTILPAWGLSNAAATLVGQNLGAKQPERAEQSVWTTARYTMFFMLGVSVLYLVFAEPIIAVFNPDPLVIKNGALSLRVISSCYFLYAYGMVLSQSFNGAGDTKTPTYINLLGFWMFQIPFAYLAAMYWDWGPVGVFVAIALSESLLALMSIYIFRQGKWKKTII